MIAALGAAAPASPAGGGTETLASGAGPGGTALAWAVGGLGAPVLAALRGTLLVPFQLGPAVVSAWVVMRDVAAGCLLATLLYGVLRSQLAGVLGLPAAAPWLLLPRVAFGALGVATSLPLVRGLLLANNALCAAVIHSLPAGPDAIVRPLSGSLVPLLTAPMLGVGSYLVAALVLLGVAALACFYVVRAAEIVLLTLLLPLAAALWVAPSAAGAWKAILGELLVSIFVQAAQVVVLLVFATGMGAPENGSGASWLWSIGALTLLFRCRRLLAVVVGAAGEMSPASGRMAAVLTPAIGASARGAERLLAGAARLRQGL